MPDMKTHFGMNWSIFDIPTSTIPTATIHKAFQNGRVTEKRE